MEVGRLNVITYDKVLKHLVIVPVNDASAQDVATELNRIYAQAVAEWDVTIDQPFNIEPSYLSGLDEGESGMLASFPAKMREFNRQFKRSRNIDKDVYYLFLVKGSGSTKKGFMPFKRQFGYIFTDNLGSTPMATAIAHEVAHGAFRLRHPQSELGVTMPDNLMHNTNGTTLRKYQWDNVHDPESMVGWFQEDEESAMATKVLFVDAQKYDVKLDHPALFTNDQLTFISPSGLPIALPKTIKPSFTGTVKDKDGSIYDLDLTRGVLLAFEDNGKYYTASYSIVENDYYFKGYKLINSDPVEYKVTEAPTGSRHMVVIGPEDEYCFLDIISGYYDYTFSNVSGDYQAEGPILTSSISLSEIEIQGHVRIDNGCTQDVKLATIEVSKMDILLNGMIILNPKDNDGVMFKYTYNEKTGYIYRRITDDGDFDYLFWNGVIWKKFTPSEINQLVPEQEILTLLDIWEAIKNDPIHSSLDLAGFIPVIGMAADGLNAVIYLVEGDKTAAFLSSVAIISSGIVVGAKYGVKFVKGTKQVESVFKISDDFASGMENVIRNARNSITSEEILIPLQSNLLELAQKHGENGMQRLLSLLNDIDEVKFLYLAEELNKLENASAFFADLEKAEFETFIKNTGIGGVDAWSILKNRPQLRVKPEALEALNKVRKNTKLGDLNITDDMLSKIEGIPNVSYAQILDDLDVAIKALPEGKVIDFHKVIADGQRGLVNKNNVWDRRHSWLTLKKIKENENFLKNADEIKFEVELEQIDGISNAVPDIVITKSGTGGTTKKIIGEVKAGDNVITTNFNSQSLRYFQEIADVRDLRLFRRDGVPLTKQQVIDSWKNGGVLDDPKVEGLFEKFDRDVIKSGFNADLDVLEDFLKNNNTWFDTIFNSSF